MTLFIDNKKTPSITYFMISILPFLLFYWMIPFVAGHSIGNDYQGLTFQGQMELLFSIKSGSFPLYVPGYALGHSSSALTLSQIYHPISHLASIMPGFWEGKALEWVTFLRLFSLGLTHLVLFAFLRRLGLNTLFSFILSCITIYNLRMLDLFRYGASLEAYTGYLLLCSAIGWYYINPARPRGPICIMIATYLLVCSGHPQMMYYGLLGAGLFTLVAPSFISTVLPGERDNFSPSARFWVRTCIYIGLGVLLSSAYIIPYYFEFIAANAERVGQGYAWADTYRDTFVGISNNFFLPFRSDVHGAFGGSSLIIIAVLIPLLRVYKIKIPASIWIIWGLTLIMFLYMLGSRTPVHKLVWEYLPLASSFRIAGRISLIIPFFMMLLFAWVLMTEKITSGPEGPAVKLSPCILLVLTGLATMFIYYLLIAVSLFFQSRIMLDFAHFTPVTIRKIPRLVEILAMSSGAGSLMVLFFYGTRKHLTRGLGILLCLLTFIQIGTTLKYGTWITDRRDNPTFKQMQEQKRAKLDYLYHTGSGMYSSIVLEQLEHSFFEPFLGKIYTHVTPVSGLNEAYDTMAQERSPQQVFIEGYAPEDHSDITAENTEFEQGSVKLVYSSFNRLQFRVHSSAPLFFGFSYPYTGNWNAWLNGSSARIYRANGSAHAVKIPQGESLIEFRYRSAPAFWGMIISCTAFVIIGSYFIFLAMSGPKKIAAVALVLFLGIGLFMLWYNSLYTGDDLGNQYSWTYSPPSTAPNLAYGKKNQVSSPLTGGWLHIHSSRAVDGDRSPKSGFSTFAHEDPALTIDLYRPERIKKIILYESTNEKLVNIRPLKVSSSMDGRKWETITSISSRPVKVPIRIVLETPKNARYIQVQASGYCSLKLDEVEVYGPESYNKYNVDP